VRGVADVVNEGGLVRDGKSNGDSLCKGKDILRSAIIACCD